jgi:hypothetical protein
MCTVRGSSDYVEYVAVLHEIRKMNKEATTVSPSHKAINQGGGDSRVCM